MGKAVLKKFKAGKRIMNRVKMVLSFSNLLQLYKIEDFLRRKCEPSVIDRRRNYTAK